MRSTSFRRVLVPGVFVTLCQCSILFDPSYLKRGGRDAAGGDAAILDGADAEEAAIQTMEAASESGVEDVVDGGVDGIDRIDGAADAIDATSDDGSLDSTADARPADVGTDAVDTDGALGDGADAAVIDASDSSTVAVAAGLLALYRFDETSGTTSADASGKGNTATMNGATFAPGLRGNAATMNGNGQYVTLPSGILVGLTSFSICTWAKFNSVLVLTRVFDFGTGANSYVMFDPFNSSTASRFSITVGGRPGEQRFDGPVFTTGTWQHVAITRNGTTNILYVDGINVSQATIALSPADLGVTTQNWLGRGQSNNNPYLDGQLDQLRIYNRGLSAAEVMQLFQLQQ